MSITRRVFASTFVGALAGCLGDRHGDEGPSDTEPSFTEVSSDTSFDYVSTDTGIGNGDDGVYVADYDNDLRQDVLVIGGDDPALFHNNGGEFERSDALPEVTGDVQGALFFDHDNDDWEDLLLLRRGETPIFLENHEGTFSEKDVGLDDPLDVPLAASAADYTGDGYLDLFVVQYGDWTKTTPRGWHDSSPFDMEEDNGNPNVLYRGSGDRFQRVEGAGIEGDHWSMATSFVDLTGDGYPDIHVANDFFNDTIYYNDGDGTFSRTVLGEETDRNGMSSKVADVTGNGHLDIFVTNIYFPRDYDGLDEESRRMFEEFVQNRLGKRTRGNNLLVGTGDGFEYRGEELNVHEGGWGWAAIIADFTSSGQFDLFHTTQNVIRFDESDPVYVYPMMWTQRDGAFYRQNASEIGFEETDGRGAAAFDFDRDGAVDIVEAAYDGKYKLYRNDTRQGNSLQVYVNGGSLDHTAIGSRVTVTAGDETRFQVNNVKACYQSQDTRVLHFGLGGAEIVDELSVVWPNGTERRFEGVEANQLVHVDPDGIQKRISYDNGV